jgi:sugar phosphate isomerase/epimerase
MVTSPSVYYQNGEMIRDAFKKMGPYIRSVHAKDIILKEDTAQIQFEEILPGKGLLDYRVLLTELSKWPGVPLMVEHLQTAEEYQKAVEHIRRVGESSGISM